MMSQRGEFATARGDGFQVVRLPYGKDGRFGMEIFLPDEGWGLPNLQAATWAATNAQFKTQDLMLTLPRFELEYHAIELDQVLHQLGMGIAYSGAADFTPLSAANPFLSTVQHKTYIKVDEKGTEAAAATGAAMQESAPPEFRVDRPFLFTISDTQTGAILFLGRVTNPSAKG
jgi:serine protease inhibitor